MARDSFTNDFSVAIGRAINYEKNLVPNVYGMGLNDALYLLEDMHMVVKFEGSGSVISQSLKAGSKYTPDQTIIKLKLG